MARVIGQTEPVVVLVGHVLGESLSDGQGSCQVLLRGDVVVDVPTELRDFLVYISTPRLRSQALDRISREGGEPEDLDALITSGRARELPNGDPAAQLDALAGVRLMPMGHPVRVSEPDGAVVWVGHTPESTALLPVARFAAALMWEAEDHEDLPETVARLQRLSAATLDRVARLCLGDLDSLLGNQLARLELVSS